jgi:tetratricopeptide (TPR) repeat protein
MRRSSLHLVTLGAFALCLVARAAHADPDEAARLFTQGRAAMNAEDYATAADRLSRSHALDPSPGTLLNLAICEEKLGKLGSAWRHLQAVLSDLPAEDPRRPVAESQADALKGRVPWLTLRLRAQPPEDLAVAVGGEPIETEDLGSPMAVDPGSVRVVARADGKTKEQTVRVGEGERKDVDLDALLGTATQPAARIDDSGEGSPVLGYVLLGVGAAGVAVGTYLWVDLNKKQDVIDSNCDASKRCNQLGLDAAEDGKSLTPIYTGAWLVGAAGLAAGTYFLFSGDEPADTSPKVAGSPMPGGAVVGMTGRF